MKKQLAADGARTHVFPLRVLTVKLFAPLLHVFYKWTVLLVLASPVGTSLMSHFFITRMFSMDYDFAATRKTILGLPIQKLGLDLTGRYLLLFNSRHLLWDLATGMLALSSTNLLRLSIQMPS